MLNGEPTEGMLREWKRVWRQQKDRLRPNRISGPELLAYVRQRYPLEETAEEDALDCVRQTVLCNSFLAEKLPEGCEPDPVAFFVLDTGEGHQLYEQKDAIYDEVERIFVGVDLVSGYYHVEGSSQLWDELCAVQGLDEADIQNPFLVAQYVECCERMGTK
ncbi:MAG: hypothetical protein ACI4PQ_07920 [Butyricicoccaceae bacterium]